MAGTVPLTRLELKRQRENLARYRRFLPALERRQVQLQMAVQETDAALNVARTELGVARRRFESYARVMGDAAGIDVRGLAEPTNKAVGSGNVAGVTVPVFEGVTFPEARYSLFATPPWVDRALADLRAVTRFLAEVDVLAERRRLLRHELVRVVQRVNLFGKVKIPEAEDAIHRIRIHLGDEMAAAVGRAKIAKARLRRGNGNGGSPAAASAADGEAGGAP